MPTMQDEVSVAANATVTNVLSGELYEFLPQDAKVVVFVNGSAVGLRVTFLAAGVALINDQRAVTQARTPVVPDDVLTEEIAPAGARLILSIRNTTNAALTTRWRVDVGFN